MVQPRGQLIDVPSAGSLRPHWVHGSAETAVRLRDDKRGHVSLRSSGAARGPWARGAGGAEPGDGEAREMPARHTRPARESAQAPGGPPLGGARGATKAAQARACVAQQARRTHQDSATNANTSAITAPFI